MDLRSDLNQPSWRARELLVRPSAIMPFDSKKSTFNADAPATEKSAPLLKLASESRYGFRNGSPNALAVNNREFEV